MLEDLEYRKKALDLANFRAKLVEELSEQANAEGELDEPGPVMRFGRLIERYDGAGMFRETDFVRISSAFQRQFGKVLAGEREGRYGAASFAWIRSPRPCRYCAEPRSEGRRLASVLSAEGKTSLLRVPRRHPRQSDSSAHSPGPPSTRYRVAD